MAHKRLTLDGNEAVAHVAYQMSEVIAIYPITPASPMGEWADQWAAEQRPNIWGTVPTIVEMQSEAGAAGAVHGALQTGALATTFTASQGLLLMLPNMYKIAGELTPTVFHIAARAVATHALSIFGDHSDVMAARPTGFAMLFSASVQEAMDVAAIAHAATLSTRLPFLHIFDGFRTSHEIATIDPVTTDQLRAMSEDRLISQHRARALSPDHPVIRGTAQNPDVFFQAREAAQPFYDAAPLLVQASMDRFATLTGRQYHLFAYHGAPDADRVIIAMGSAVDIARETVDALSARGEKVGVLGIHLYRPFSTASFLASLPATVRRIAVLDRTKEAGSTGEPLYQDCVAALHEGVMRQTIPQMPRVIGGRYGLSSKDLTPAMLKGVFDYLSTDMLRQHFTIGINDDVSHSSIDSDTNFVTEPDDVVTALFYGLGSDGTVGANKNAIKIIGEKTNNYAQGYFVYDSKKAGTVTISHLRFGPRPIRSSYLVDKARFVACHQPAFLTRYDMLHHSAEGGTFLLNTPYAADEIWDHLPRTVQQQLIDKHIHFYVIDAARVARESGLGRQINTVMQVCFFAISQVLPRGAAIAAIKEAIAKSYGRKGAHVVEKNVQAVDRTLDSLAEVTCPLYATSLTELPPIVPANAPRFVRDIIAPMIAGNGDLLPVSALPVDGTFPVGTTQWEKRNLAEDIPVWDPDICIQCGKCAMVCPHGVIRIKIFDEAEGAQAPASFKMMDARDREWKGKKYSIQVAPEDCTGCAICATVCPARKKTELRHKALMMAPQPALLEQERANWDFFRAIPDIDRRLINVATIRQQQVQQPLFEFSGACSGCGETPYLKLLSQLFGDRLLIANATGCSSIYGGNLPTTPWTTNHDGRGPAWANSLFEDNAEFGLGFRVSIDTQIGQAHHLIEQLRPHLSDRLVDDILSAQQADEAGIFEQRQRVEQLKHALGALGTPLAERLGQLSDALVRRSVWIVGGDGWAYDIGFGGLDHVLASGHNVKVLVMDTEVYSNTGGQQSKATPRGAVAKFAAGGKPVAKKDLGLIAMSYGSVYVASIAMGARDEQTLKAFLEADAYDGPALIIAYSHCIAHGIADMSQAMSHQKAAVDSGQWLLYRFNPERAQHGEPPLIIDSRPASIPVSRYHEMENRFAMLARTSPDRARHYLAEAQHDADARWAHYEALAHSKPATAPSPH